MIGDLLLLLFNNVITICKYEEIGIDLNMFLNCLVNVLFRLLDHPYCVYI